MCHHQSSPLVAHGLLKMLFPSAKEFEHVSLLCVHLFINYIYWVIHILCFKNIDSLEIKKNMNIKKNASIIYSSGLFLARLGVQEPHFGDYWLNLAVSPQI